MFKRILSVFALIAALGAYVAPQTASAGDGFAHHVVFQINADDPALMNLVLNNVENVKSEFESSNQKVQIEVVAYGPGLKMLLADSPVAPRIQNMSAASGDINFAACGNTMKKMSKKAGKDLELLEFSNVKMVPAGVIRIMELQDMGWHYIKP